MVSPEVAMAAPVPLRTDFDATRLRTLAKQSLDADQTRRLLALAAIYDGASRTEAAPLGCGTLQIARGWAPRRAGRRRGRRGGPPPRGGPARLRHTPDRAGLGAALQCQRTEGAKGPKSL